MSYDYKIQRAQLFTESGTEVLLKVRDNVKSLIETAGAFTADKSWRGCTGDTWTMLAALDYLCERGEILRMTPKGGAWGQDEVFTRVRK